MENIEILVDMQENVTAKMPGVTSSLINSKSAMRELTMGATYLGSAMLGMGVAMQMSNNEAARSVGNVLALVGGILTAVGSAAHFVSAIAKMTSALNKMNIAQILANALSGPGGWAKIAIGVGIAGAAAFGVSKAMTTVSSKEDKTAQVVVHNHIAGSVVTERSLVDAVQKGLLQKQDRSVRTGIK